jgi:hypothetical protein
MLQADTLVGEPTASAVVDGLPHQISTSYLNPSASLLFDGSGTTAIGYPPIQQPGSSLPLYLGSDPTGILNNGTFILSEFIVCTQTQTSPLDSSVRAYLKAKWGTP